MTDILALRRLTPIPTGKQRHVFRHPHDPSLMVKVPSVRLVGNRGGADAGRYKLPKRERHLNVLMRELREHLAVRAQSAETPRFMQDIVGFVETDLGIGLVSRAILGRDGELAPNLRDIFAAGTLTTAMCADLHTFFAWLLDSPIVVGDLHAGNLIHGYDPAYGSFFAVIDGIGDKNLIPFNSWSRWLNRRSKLRRIARINRMVDWALLQQQTPSAPATLAPAAER